MNKKEKVVLTTGGTGGHIYPALAIAKKLKDKNIDVLFIGTSHRMEKTIVPNEGYRFIGLDIVPLKSVSAVFKILKGTLRSIRILRREKATKVIGFGNYISIPVILAAKFLRIPYYLQEQNSIMGLANKKFYKGSKKVFLAFRNTLNSIPGKYREKFIVTGNPLREEFYHKEKAKEREKLGITEEEKVLFIIGGSLGAKNINEAVLKKWDKIQEMKNLRLFWGTGKDLFEEVISKITDYGSAVVLPYFDNAADIMCAADMVLCRAGASTVSELIQLEKPSIVIPYDFVGQKENAEEIEFVNGTKIFENKNVSDAIDEALLEINQPDILDFMSENLKTMKKGNAVCSIVKHIDLEEK